MRDHLIALRVASAPARDRDAHRAAIEAALGPDFVARCADRVSADQADCVLAAADPTSVAACMAGGAP